MEYTVEAVRTEKGSWDVVANGDVIFRGMSGKQARKAVRELLGDVAERCERAAGWSRYA